MSAPIYIFVNGIWNLPSSSKGWQDQAVTWIQTRTAARAEKFEYYAMALTRRMFQARHAEALYQRNDVTNIWRDHYGHSDWFKKENFEGTLRLICPHAGPATDTETTNTKGQ